MINPVHVQSNTAIAEQRKLELFFLCQWVTAADGGNLKRNFERDGVIVAEVSFSNDPENGPVFTLRDVEARESYSFDSIDLIAMEIYDLLY